MRTNFDRRRFSLDRPTHAQSTTSSKRERVRNALSLLSAARSARRAFLPTTRTRIIAIIAVFRGCGGGRSRVVGT